MKKAAFITGGSRGIGRAIAVRLAAEGYAVGIDYLNSQEQAEALVKELLHRKEGRIVTLSSMWGQVGASCEAAYSATKAALIGLTRSLAMELAPSGIRVNCIAPGVIFTDMVKVLGDETLAMLAEQTPMGRLGTPEDIAKLAAFLAGESASFVTGQVITADGGFIV